MAKHNWGKWQHIDFVEDFRVGIKTYELLRRECTNTGLVQWKRVYVKQCVHNLVHTLKQLFKGKEV